MKPAKEKDEENHSADIGIEVQLTCLQADIAGENVIKDDVLYEVVSVILFSQCFIHKFQLEHL